MRGSCRLCRFLQISECESNTPDALRAGGFNRSTHSTRPSRDSRSELSGLGYLTVYECFSFLFDELVDSQIGAEDV